MNSFRALKLIMVSLTIFYAGCSEDTLDDTGLGTITGIVVEIDTNEPVENAKISTNPATSTVFTDENGEFTLIDVPAEDYSVEARKEGLLTQFEGASVLANATVRVIFEMQMETGDNRQPSAPVAVSPKDKSEGIATTTEFSWSSADPDNDDLVYTLEIRNDRDEEIFLFQDIRDTTYTVEGLEFDHKYFWQVRASDEVNPEVLSSLFSFRTMGVPQSRILFTRNLGVNSVIFAINEEGKEFQLTPSNQNSFRPRKNNASNSIAFLRTVGGQTHLFLMNSDGSQQRQITSNIPVNGFDLEQVDFSWAENGASLIFPNFEKLYRINTSGGGAELLYQTSNGDFITEVAVSENDEFMALITNNSSGYDADLFTIDFEGRVQDRILTNVSGALGGLDISVRNEQLLYVHDTSGFENESYRRLDSRIFVYDFTSGQTTDFSLEKPEGTNDLDPRFSPNEAEIIFVNTSNDGISRRDLYSLRLEEIYEETERRAMLMENSAMPDWE